MKGYRKDACIEGTRYANRGEREKRGEKRDRKWSTAEVKGRLSAKLYSDLIWNCREYARLNRTATTRTLILLHSLLHRFLHIYLL